MVPLEGSRFGIVPKTQNPPLATAYRFDSGHRHHVGASSVSLAPTFFQKSERTHAAAPPFQIEPATLGFDLVLGANLEPTASIMLQLFTSEQSSLCSDVFYAQGKKRHPPASLLLLSKSQPLTLGCDLVSGANRKAAASIPFPGFFLSVMP